MLVGGESLVGKDVPGEFEQVVLLALAAQDTRATGRMVYEAIRAATGREPSVAAVHITLGRLVEKGWAECTTLSPDPVRGGKPRRRYALSPAGAATLKRLRTQLEAFGNERPAIPCWATRRRDDGSGPRGSEASHRAALDSRRRVCRSRRETKRWPTWTSYGWSGRWRMGAGPQTAGTARKSSGRYDRPFGGRGPVQGARGGERWGIGIRSAEICGTPPFRSDATRVSERW